jgi:hypothetical protein
VCTLEQWPIIEISEAEFGALKQAKTSLLTFLSMEEKFDALLENYSEYERELLSLALDHMVHSGGLTWTSMISDVLRINRRLANLLTMTRLYTDQVTHDISTLSVSAQEVLSQCFSREYDTHFEYRLMEALRNHVQHQGMPITGASYPRSWEDRGEQRMTAMRFSFTPALDLDQLLENQRLKASVRAELTQCEQLPDVSILVRKYVESFSRIHDAVRASLTQLMSDCSETFLSAFTRSESRLGARKHVDLIMQDADGRTLEQIAIVRDLSERITLLRQRNPHLATLSRWYVSNDVR